MRDLVLIHGALGAAKEFDPFVPLLTPHFNVSRFDLSGHGENSSQEVFSLELFANDLRQHIAKHKLVKPQVFGFSLGGYVAYKLASESGEILGDLMSLGTMLKWDPLIAKRETNKMLPERIEEKVPKFAAYLDSIHLDWKENMLKMTDFMHDLGNGAAMTFEDFSRIKNKCYIGLGDMDEMVSCQETLDVDAALPNSHYYKLPNSRHPLPQLNPEILNAKIIEFLK